MKVELSGRALREMHRIDARWREEASHSAVFLDELEQTIERIESTSILGPGYEATTRYQVHRLLLEKSECHVYLARKSEGLVVILSIWGARRRRGPKL